VVEARQWFEEKFEDYVAGGQVAFVPRFARELVDGSGCRGLRFPHYPVRSVISAGTYSGSTLTAFSVDDLADLVVPSDTGYVERRARGTWLVGSKNVLLEYEHGLGTTAPAIVVDVAKIAIHDMLQGDATVSRANRQFSVATEVGVVRSSTAGPDRPFGIPAVDQLANEMRSRYYAPAVA
jgi:hypothetical protein